MSSTPSTSNNAGSGIPVIVDPRLVVETRAWLLAEAFCARMDQPGPGLSRVLARISNSFSPGDPMSAIANGATEADAASDVAVTTDTATITAAIKAAYITVSKVNEMSSAFSWDAETRGLLARGAADKIDYDGLSQFGSLTNVTGTTGTRWTLAKHRAAITALSVRAKNRAGRIIGVHHNTVIGMLIDEVTSGAGAAASMILCKDGVLNLFGEDGSNSGMREAAAGVILGVPQFQTTNVPTANAGADYAGAFIIPPADTNDVNCTLGLLNKWKTMVSKYDLEILMQQAFRYAANTMYGFNIIKQDYGEQALASAT